MKEEFSTDFGRVKIVWPEGLTKEVRIELLEEMLGWHKAPSKPLDFGDLRLKKVQD